MFETQQNIEITCLNESHIADFIALRDHLPEDKKDYVKPRTVEDLVAHLGAPMPMIGVFKGGELVAGALLTYPKHAEHTKYLDQYPLNETTAVLQAVVSTEKGMMRHLYEAAADLARMQGYTTLVAKVRADNSCMIASIERNGFQAGPVLGDPLGTAPCGVHFARAVIGLEPPPVILPPPVPDPQVCQSPTAEIHPEFQPEHTV